MSKQLTLNSPSAKHDHFNTYYTIEEGEVLIRCSGNYTIDELYEKIALATEANEIYRKESVSAFRQHNLLIW